TAIRDKSFPENLELARNWVADYAYKYRQVLTSRLHANLPARSVGAEVDFEPKNKSDSRFGGLIGINDDEFDAIREGILDKLSVLIPLIATGASEDAIYAKWKEITAEDMAVADEYLASAHLSSAESTAIASAVGEVERPVSEPEVTDIFMTVETGEQPLVVASVESIDRQASQRYRVWLPSGVLSPEQINDLHPRLSNGEVHVLAPISFDGIANTNDLVQALLPVLFPDHERIVVVPAAAEISADIVELSNVELGDALVAAKHDVRKNRSSGLTLMRRIASSFGEDHVGTLKVVFASHIGMSEACVPFQPQVAVLTLEELPTNRIVELTVALLADVGVSYADAMQIAIRGRYRDLDSEWNVLAHWETFDNPKIVNWRRQTRHYGQMALNR